ncbi:lon protease homolog 2, peroxisomal-like isoform X1 [Melanaphis sacchari]|uniref:Lon protease homolog n=1 Tax=Melanaphis sacchari TaxID=742174 RepID=A0A2H8TKP7_9HEMI|nr:lon protease homolog 2, peroxisomal-like isoform X1 [Melanaphis sacchari]
MDIPNELPIIYTTPVLIPGFILKIRLQVEKYFNLLNYLQTNHDTKSIHIGIIPNTDFEKVSNVIGTVGLVRSIITVDSDPKDFVLVLEGICRFKLDIKIAEEPLQINKIIKIENFKNLQGDEKEVNELVVEFNKVVIDYLTYSESNISNLLAKESFKVLFNKLPLYKTVAYCLKTFVRLTPADAYTILRATNLNDLLRFVTDWLKRETIKENKYSNSEKTGLIPVPLILFNDINSKKNVMFKIPASHELYQILKAIKDSGMPTPIHKVIMKEFKRLNEMNSSNPDYSVFINYISYVANLPWNKRSKETLDLEKAKNMLKSNHYGMDKVKNRILQFIAVKILNPDRRGPILCFVGPPGVGKTSIVKAIASSLNRTFKRISLGGINHYSDIKGHRRTYIGAMPGCIIQAINQTKTNNPVILLDEIDKMYKGTSGDPAAALLEVLDPEQNNSFVDSYVNLPFDISQVMFISTANSVFKIPHTLRDRMEIIYLEGYTEDEKIQIAELYLIPKILKDHNMNELQITICKNTIKDIIQKYTNETGVRELQRKLEVICHYIAVDIVENSDKKIKKYVITPELLLNILDSELYNVKNTLVEGSCNRVGVSIGLSWTPVGGKVQIIEATKLYSRNEKNGLILTGLAGQTLRESVVIAQSWIQSFVKNNEVNIQDFCVHVHLPTGGIPKDGPSAGISIVCALISLYWKIPLKSMIGMTGEMSLNGYVLPIGGVKEKILAAYKSNIRTVIIPELNLKDLKKIPKNIREDLNIIPVKHVEEVLDIVIPGGLAILQNPSFTTIEMCKL